MERIDSNAVVIDAGPLIHLDELDCLDLLADLGPLVTTNVVWDEVRRHRPSLQPEFMKSFRLVSPVPEPSAHLAVLADTLNLDAGEITAIAFAERYRLRMFLTDDTAPRLAAESAGIAVRGTIGVLIRAIRRKTRSRDQVLDLLMTIRQRSTLHISKSLLASVIEAIERGPSGSNHGKHV